MADERARELDDLGERIDAAAAALGDRARREVPLGERTTYRVGGSARLAVEATSTDDLIVAGQVASRFGLPVVVIGRGSNMLVTDAGFDGIALSLGEPFTEITTADGSVSAGAATVLPVLARRSVALGHSGLEWMVGVPGTVGGAVRMNAGGHGADVASSLIDAEVVDLSGGTAAMRSLGDLELRFRGSNLTATDVVTSARFTVTPLAELDEAGERSDGAGETMLADIVRWRREHQPGGQNAGSVFVNPDDGAESAGRLIDEAGMKGLRHRSAQVSPKHANFIQADPGGSADDILELMRIVAATVEDRTGHRLRSEIRLIGFADPEILSPTSGDQHPEPTP